MTNNSSLTETQTGAKKTDGQNSVSGQQDASRKEVIFYAMGNVEASISDNFLLVLQQIMIVAMHVNPLLTGFIMAIKTMWDSLMDPIVAYFSDNAQSRWGRRRPFIMVGGVGRVLFLLAFVLFLPTGGHLAQNSIMEAQRCANASSETAIKAHETALKCYNQWDGAGDDAHAKMMERVARIPAESRDAFQKIAANLGPLQEDAHQRAKALDTSRLALEKAQNAHEPLEVKKAQIQIENASEKLTKAEELIAKARRGQQHAIAAESVASLFLATPVPQANGGSFGSPAEAQKRAEVAFADAGLEPFDVFSAPHAAALPQPQKSGGPFDSLINGMRAFTDAHNADQRKLVIYVLCGVLISSVFAALFSTPYYALGIELSPSYNGRTQVVTYRAVFNKIAGLLAPWFPVFCFSLVFTNALQGLFWVALLACVVGVPCTIIMCWYVRERAHRSAAKKTKTNPFRAIWEIGKNPYFLRIFFLYAFIGLVNGLFAQIGFFLNVYWIMGSALSGATLGAWVSMVAWGVGFLSLPVINWACRRFQKHRVLQAAIIWMTIGTALKWWAMTPAHPEFQFVLPLFFSLGISSVFTVLPTMMADVTDVDQFLYGERREGMFGAVMASMTKIINSMIPILAGAFLLLAGFNPALEYKQEASTILHLRLMYSLIPAGMLIFALGLVWRYPLTREKVTEIKAEVERKLRGEQSGGLCES